MCSVLYSGETTLATVLFDQTQSRIATGVTAVVFSVKKSTPGKQYTVLLNKTAVVFSAKSSPSVKQDTVPDSTRPQCSALFADCQCQCELHSSFKETT